MKPKSKYWFKAKSYGWGWYPATWQGWLILGVFIFLFLANSYRFDAVSPSVSDTLLNFIPENLLIVIVLIAICYWKGEKPSWRWGGKEIKFKK